MMVAYASHTTGSAATTSTPSGFSGEAAASSTSGCWPCGTPTHSGNTTARPRAEALSSTAPPEGHWSTGGGGGGGRSQSPASAAVVDALVQHLHPVQPEVWSADAEQQQPPRQSAVEHSDRVAQASPGEKWKHAPLKDVHCVHPAAVAPAEQQCPPRQAPLAHPASVQHCAPGPVLGLAETVDVVEDSKDTDDMLMLDDVTLAEPAIIVEEPDDVEVVNGENELMLSAVVEVV